jgi:hypothetical protein
MFKISLQRKLFDRLITRGIIKAIHMAKIYMQPAQCLTPFKDNRFSLALLLHYSVGQVLDIPGNLLNAFSRRHMCTP